MLTPILGGLSIALGVALVATLDRLRGERRKRELAEDRVAVLEQREADWRDAEPRILKFPTRPAPPDHPSFEELPPDEQRALRMWTKN